MYLVDVCITVSLSEYVSVRGQTFRYDDLSGSHQPPADQRKQNKNIWLDFETGICRDCYSKNRGNEKHFLIFSKRFRRKCHKFWKQNPDLD